MKIDLNDLEFREAPPLFYAIMKQLHGQEIDTIHNVLVNILAMTLRYAADAEERSKAAAVLKKSFCAVIDHHAMTEH
jgi:hypothetical protein